jgi:HSP20 family protein
MKLITHCEPQRVWNPFREMQELQGQLASLLQLPAVRAQDGACCPAPAPWAPLVDITEDEHEYTLKAELPEVLREDVSVRVESGVLTLTGERKAACEEKGRHYHRIERAYGRFTRSFTLPEDADGEKVSAEFKDGVLLVHVPKSEKARAKTIEVKVA